MAGVEQRVDTIVLANFGVLWVADNQEEFLYTFDLLGAVDEGEEIFLLDGVRPGLKKEDSAVGAKVIGIEDVIELRK